MKQASITRAAMAVCAAAVMATDASGDTNYMNAVVYCKATIMPSGEQTGDMWLSVSLPETPGAVDEYGQPVTLWNVGEMVAGGVADTWHAEGGPGRFVARNTGNVAAYVYVTTGIEPGVSHEYDPMWWEQLEYIYPDADYYFGPRPTPRVEYPDNQEWRTSYHLALSTDVTAKTPVWRPLEYVAVGYSNLGSGYYGRDWRKYRKEDGYYVPYYHTSCAAYLAYMPAGEYQPFDLKFWAPLEPLDIQMAFIFRVEASSFRRWEHDR